MSQQKEKVLVWHRNDLRVLDHSALSDALTEGAETEGCFISTEAQWQQHGHGGRKTEYYRHAAGELAEAYQQHNLTFHHRCGSDFSESVRQLQQLLLDRRITVLAFHAEYELNEYQRDLDVAAWCREQGIALRIYHDQILCNPEKIRTQAEQPFRVFTPFMKRWRALLDHSETFRLRESPVQPVSGSFEEQSHERLNDFLSDGIGHYHQRRDLFAEAGTSELSAALAAGLLSVRQCHHAALAGKNQYTSEGTEVWRNELIWREFYKYISYHFPHVCRGESFRQEYDRLQWNENDRWLELWQQGMTGYPVVDAAQRCLNVTGFMPNRLRMVTAMFLTKDLGLNWRHGEAWFMEQLTDGDFSANNGGWQWSASTGVDAAPYFRIFNPVEQGRRFDPRGAFIRRWVPELAALSDKDIQFPSDQQRRACGYPQAVVEHREARQQTLDRFKALK